MQVTLEGIRRAAEQIRGAVVETPCLHSQTLSRMAGCEVFLKLENLQFTGSFKERGALVKLLELSDDERRRGVVTMSAGNHAQAVAHHATRLGVSSCVVMPRFTPNAKVENTRVLGAEVVLRGDSLEEAREVAHQMEADSGRVFVHPYDDPDVIRGQGTVGLEMLAAHPDLDVLVVPIGGGGLCAGVAVAAHGLQPDIEIFGVQCQGFASMAQALAGEPIECGGATIAEGIAVARPGDRTLPLLRDHLRDVLRVDESALERAVLLFLEIEKTVVEGAGAAALAAVLAQPERFRGRRVGLVVSGGNIDLAVLASIIERGLVRTGRNVRFFCELPDVPGALADVSRVIGDAGGNILAVHHQRAFTNSPLHAAEVEFVLEARGPDHVHEIATLLRASGYATHGLES